MLNSVLLIPVLVGAATVALAVLAQALTRRIPLVAKAPRTNDVVGFYLGFVGVLYAVAHTFVMVAAWGNQDHVRELVDREALTLGTIGFLARGLPEPYAERLIDHTKAYAQTVLDAEWPSLARGHESSELDEDGAHIGLTLLDYAPGDAHGRMLADHLTTAFIELRNIRRERRLAAEYRIPAALWVLMIYGALITLGLCFLFEVKSRGLHHAKTALLASFIVMSLLVTWDLQDPFQGVSNVSPEPFSNLLRNEATFHEDVWARFKADYANEEAKRPRRPRPRLSFPSPSLGRP